jgi:hypothetical protein
VLHTLAIIPCTSQKADEPGPARDVWTGVHFQLTLMHAEEFYDRTVIMSFKYGLITPDDLIEPYDMNIHKEPLKVRVQWKRMMMQHIQREMSGELDPKPGIVGLYVGGIDVDWLYKAFTGRGARVIQPWKGLGTGQRQEAAYGGTSPFVIDGLDIREDGVSAPAAS